MAADTSTKKALANVELKKFLHQLVVNICDEAGGKNYSEDFQMELTNSTMELLEHMISKLNDFASHAKRKKITVDDIFLYFRSRPVMLSVLKGAMANESSDDDDSNRSILSLGNDSD